MAETIRFARIGKEDINFGTGTFEVRLADGRVVVMEQVDIGEILSDAALSTRSVTLDSLTVTTLNPTTGTFTTATITGVLTVTGTLRIPEKADPSSLTSGEIWINSSGTVIEYADDASTPAQHTLVAEDTTQTLTNKTLTSPTVNTPTITGGSWTGGTDLAVADGGTGASTAAAARANLGVDPFANEGLKVYDTDSSNSLILKPGSNLTADRILTLTTGDAARTVTITANVTLNAPITEIVAPTSFPAANAVSITDISQTYAALMVVINGVSSDTATRAVRLNVSHDNGSSFNTDSMYGEEFGAGANIGNTNSASAITQGAIAAAQTCSLAILLIGYQTGSFLKVEAAGVNGGGRYAGSTVYVVTTAIDAIRLILDGTGNFDAGTYALYGFN